MPPPTLEQVQAGKAGNGVWESTAQALELHRTAAIEKGRKAKERREAQFEERAKDKLDSAIGLYERLIDRANALLDRKDAGEVLTKDEIAEVKAGERAAAEVANRAIGRSVAKVESTTTNNWVSYINGDVNLG